MTDRIHALTVVIDRDLRIDDSEMLINAIKMLKGVCEVTHHVSDISHYCAMATARIEIKKKLIDLFEKDHPS